MFTNIPEVKLGIIAVSRDCFPIVLSERRRRAIVEAYTGELYECPVTVENEKDMLSAVADVNAAGCNAIVVFLGNFGPETPETLIAKHFDGPCMFVAAAEGDGDLIDGRGDAYCGMLNCSYNLGMRHLKGYIPEYPVGTAEDIARMIAGFIPVARAVIGVKNLKVITFGPRPQDFFACNAPIKGLYELGVEIEENSELDLLVSFQAHAGDERIPAVCAEMAKEMGEGAYYPDLNERMAQFELTLLDWAETHKGARKYVAFANKCWPAFPSQFGSRDAVTLLDINNSVPQSIYDEDIAGTYDCKQTDTFMAFHCGNTPSCKMCADRAVKYQLIQHRVLEPEGSKPDISRGTLEGDIAPGDIPSGASVCLPSRRWAGSTAMCSSRSAIPTTEPWPLDIMERRSSRYSSSWACKASPTTSPRACPIPPKIPSLKTLLQKNWPRGWTGIYKRTEQGHMAFHCFIAQVYQEGL